MSVDTISVTYKNSEREREYGSLVLLWNVNIRLDLMS